MRNPFSVFNKLLLIDGLYEGGRMFVGATSVTYLLNSGLTLSNIAFLKSVQAIVLIIAELPTGIFADALGRRLSLFFSTILSIIGFGFYFMGSNLSSFVIAESLTALSLCFWSGAYESFAIDNANLNGSSLDEFFHMNSSINSALVLIFGLIGGWLGSKGLQWPYLGAIISFGFLLLILFNFKNDKEINFDSNNSFKSWIKNSLNSLINQFNEYIKIILSKEIINSGLFGFIFVQILIQFLIQPILHYWQPYFSTLNSKIGTNELGYIFALYCGASVISGSLASALSKKSWFRTITSTWILFAMCSITFVILGQDISFLNAVFIFAIFQGLLKMARTSLSVRINSEISNKSRASILSFMNLISKMGMISSLSFLAEFKIPKLMYFQYSMIGIFVVIITGLILFFKNLKEISNDFTEKINF